MSTLDGRTPGGIGLDYIRKRCPDLTPDEQRLVYRYFNTPVPKKHHVEMHTPVVERAGYGLEKCKCGRMYEKRAPKQFRCPTCQDEADLVAARAYQRRRRAALDTDKQTSVK